MRLLQERWLRTVLRHAVTLLPACYATASPDVGGQKTAVVPAPAVASTGLRLTASPTLAPAPGKH